MLTDPALTLADQIFWIVDCFRRTMAPEGCRRRIGALSIAVWCRVQRFERRFCSLYAMWKAGTLPRVRREGISRRPAPERGEREDEGEFDPAACDAATMDRARLRPASVLPRAFGWLHAMLPMSAAALGGGVDSLLCNFPEMQAFAAACPQVRRILRPVCKMAGLKLPEYLALPKRARVRRSDPPPRSSPATAGEGEGRRRRTPREMAAAAMEKARRTGKPVDPKKLG